MELLIIMAISIFSLTLAWVIGEKIEKKMYLKIKLKENKEEILKQNEMVKEIHMAMQSLLNKKLIEKKDYLEVAREFLNYKYKGISDVEVENVLKVVENHDIIK